MGVACEDAGVLVRLLLLRTVVALIEDSEDAVTLVKRLVVEWLVLAVCSVIVAVAELAVLRALVGELVVICSVLVVRVVTDDSAMVVVGPELVVRDEIVVEGIVVVGPLLVVRVVTDIGTLVV